MDPTEKDKAAKERLDFIDAIKESSDITDKNDKSEYETFFLQNIFNIQIMIETNIPQSKPTPLTSSIFIKPDITEQPSLKEKFENYPLSSLPFCA